MGSRFLSHQLSNGLYVSGRPEQPKERTPTMSSVAMPYTGGDIKKTGSFGGAASHSGPIMPTAAPRAGYTTSGPGPTGGVSVSASLKKSNSGQLNRHWDPVKRTSGPQYGGLTPSGRQHSDPIPLLPATGLITSGPISSGPLNSSGAPRKVYGPLDSTGSMKVHGSAVNIINHNDLSQCHSPHFVVILFGIVAALFTWNSCWGRRAIMGFITHYPDVELRNAKNGQFVKISGVVTCGNMPLESSFQKFPRCVYTSTSLYKYHGWDSKAVNPKHHRFTWGHRLSERHAVDFYFSDFQSGLRALVKTGYGARVTPYVDDSIVIDVNPAQETLPLDFIRWLGERNLSSGDRVMRIKEGYIKEGSTVSVMGVVQGNDSVLMIAPPPI
ncbi:Detected protein of confused Function [Hibiscus syriacus]|uniref:Detected protein of confused Function n=1 Tax=Hibiscus syriacus TaxID=106335 RepID=A0A6A2YUJ5_HIBSY|nr:Detected protein of confused Function [Hibiscus syriacus]